MCTYAPISLVLFSLQNLPLCIYWSSIMSRASKFKTTTNSCWVIYSVLKSECQKRKQKTPLYIDSNHRVGNMYFNVISVGEFQRWWVLKIKVFGQESTVVKWNYQILGLHPVTVRQKLGLILVINGFKNWFYQKMSITTNMLLNRYSSMKKKSERFRWFLT